MEINLKNTFTKGNNLGIIQGSNQLGDDLAVEHEKIIWASVFNALREITGKEHNEPGQMDLIEKHLHLLFPDHKRYFDIEWKGELIIRVHAPAYTYLSKDCVIRKRKINEVWKKRWPGILH